LSFVLLGFLFAALFCFLKILGQGKLSCRSACERHRAPNPATTLDNWIRSGHFHRRRAEATMGAIGTSIVEMNREPAGP